ncbi:MAG TPA: adenosylcobalamin-dependent ribonucleoside-diphosphate reductase [Burkholderiaceae bacterium]|nr:adenosylcobalamin-dependent ribonucleoside-diphosphate reductase [Burkholderiaceae bacterium]
MKLDKAQLLLDEQPISIDVLLEKYAKGDEKTVDEVRRRVARGLAHVEKPEVREAWERRFYEAMVDGFIPGGRVNSAAGTGIAATLINCFVQPVGDAISGRKNGVPSIYLALNQAAETMRRGGGVGYDFSPIRPKGALVHGTHSRASGPISYMRVFDKSCETLESAGARRGAQMGMMRCDHPDIEEFIHAKRDGSLANFNMSVAVTDEFMRAVDSDGAIELWHAAEPFDKSEAYQRADGSWVYRKARARDLFDQIMQSTYSHAEPGVIFVDRVNADNNLSYCETIAATNPCGEQPLPPYGCCCLGSINLTRFVVDPFGERAAFDWDRFRSVTKVSVRALDNVLDVTLWPLEEQAQEAANKRRIGLGFTGLGNTLTMLGLRYDSEAARTLAADISRTMRDAAYEASVENAREKGAFPLFNADKFLAEPHCASRVPDKLKSEIRAHGIRNSHLLSIAPTGTISLAFAGNASGGIEPTFSWTYIRKKRMPDGTKQEYIVEDYAYRLYKRMGGDENQLPAGFVSALEMSARDHMKMIAAVQPYVDAAISKTVNVPEDYPFEEFKNLYLEAWKSGLKGITTYRPNNVIGSVLEVVKEPATSHSVSPQDLKDDPDRRVRLDSTPQPALASLKWPGRPDLAEGNLAWTYMVEIPERKEAFAIFIGQVGEPPAPFEVWVNGAEQPRGLGAIAKALSMDMRSEDRAWLKMKLDALAKARDEQGFALAMPPTGEKKWQSGVVACFANIVRFRCEQLGVFREFDHQPTPVLNALFSKKEPKAGPLGTMSWTVDVSNANTGDDFVLGVKELHLPDGSRRPYSIWLAGEYPKVLDGLCKLISLDMRVVDVNWIGLKLKKLLNFGEQNGEFWAAVPGEERSALYPSTVAYIATLLLHRYKVLGILDDDGRAIQSAGILALPDAVKVIEHETAPVKGKVCASCGAAAVIKRDGCEFCTACGATGHCS